MAIDHQDCIGVMADIDLVKQIGNELGFLLRPTRPTKLNQYFIREKPSSNEYQLDGQGALIGLNLELASRPYIRSLFSNFPTTILECKDLRFLTFSGSKIRKLPEAIGNLSRLEELDLGSNKLEHIPNVLSRLTNLHTLVLSNNQICDLYFLKGLVQLKYLILSSNQIVDISALKNLSQLERVDLSHNLIQDIPDWTANLNMDILHRYEDRSRGRGWDVRVSEGVDFSGNPIKTPPVDIVEQGKEAIQNYFTQLEKEKGKTEYLFEAKLLVIGGGGTGKTTFTCKMRDVDAEMPQEKDTTLGIDVEKWSYSIDFPKVAGPGKVKFHVNLWDFGGQKIYQGTHQIFFSDKSFYVLIADTREQKTDFSYWLNTVDQLGGDNSSLVIVLNKKFGHEQKFDESGYRNHFGKLIKEVVELDLKNDRSKTIRLQDTIKMSLKQLEGIGDPLPPSWVNIREDLLKEKENFIPFTRFQEICSDHKITEVSMIHTLSGYFNRIGAFTHYIDDPLLQERIYLNSNWLVKTVYEVLDNETVIKKKGRLTEADIIQIWSKHKLQYEVNKLAQLMHNFGLMYHIPHSKDYVVPAHLPTVTPYKQWEHEKNGEILQFIYEFDKYMPQGIMSRLIVALHHHIKDHKLVWHRGVNISSNKAHAEIVESYGGSNRFEIKIAGTNTSKMELLGIIRERFEEVLRPFNKLNYKQLVPCICEECKSSTEPEFHEYEKLLKFREKGTGSQCPKTGEIVNAEELLRITQYKPTSTMETPRPENANKIIRIFLASSSELEDDRKEFEIFINRENKRLIEKGIFIKLELWEDFIDAMSEESLQNEYNKVVAQCDIFISLFFKKVGKYTAEEFETAFGQFKEKGKPLVYTYFKESHVNISQINAEINSKFEFEEKLASLGHFKTIYKNIDDLKNQFRMQLDKILPLLCA